MVNWHVDESEQADDQENLLTIAGLELLFANKVSEFLDLCYQVEVGYLYLLYVSFDFVCTYR